MFTMRLTMPVGPLDRILQMLDIVELHDLDLVGLQEVPQNLIADIEARRRLAQMERCSPVCRRVTG